MEGICKALEALLMATCKKTKDDRGCRSLFSICLRRTPNYIAEEQRLTVDEDPENNVDVASEVYADLEAFGSAPEGGWQSLQQVVRAHGISLVGQAIREGLIEIRPSHHILSLCLGLAAYDEAECVIESMIALMKSRPLPLKKNANFSAGLSPDVNKSSTSDRQYATPLIDEVSRVVGALKYYASQTGRHSFMYRQMAVMLEDAILPIDWISSKAMIDCWNGVIRSITQQDGYAQSAALLLRVAILRSYRKGFSFADTSTRIHDLRLGACSHSIIGPTLRSYKSSQAAETVVESQPFILGESCARQDDKDSALQSTLSNIMTVISAINILRSPSPRPDSSDSDILSVALLLDVALEIRQILELVNVTFRDNRSWSVPAEPLRLPLLSAGLVSISSRKLGSEVCPNEMLDLAALARLPSSKESLCNAGSFLVEVARCCDKAGSGDGFRFVQVMVQDLVSIAISTICDKPVRKFCSDIALAAAFAFSEDTGQPKHLDWALDIEGTITRTVNDSSRVAIDRTPARASPRMKSGYKWEEGICEWIATTPALVLQRPTAAETVDNGRTCREAPKPTLVQESPLLSSGSPGVAHRRLLHAARNRRVSCDSCGMGNAKRSCGGSNTSEKLLFVRICPRTLDLPRSQSRTNSAANDLDELYTPESLQMKRRALREIPNVISGAKRKCSGQERKTKLIETYDLDMPPTKRPCLDTETFSQDTDDELGFP